MEPLSPPVPAASVPPAGQPAAAAPAPWGVPSAAPAQARSDAHLLELWLFGKSPHTRRTYLRVAGAFLATLDPGGLGGATLGDLQTWAAAPQVHLQARPVSHGVGQRVGGPAAGQRRPLPASLSALAATGVAAPATRRPRGVTVCIHRAGANHAARNLGTRPTSHGQVDT